MKSKHMILRLFSSGFLAAILVWAGACGRKKATSEWESFAQHVVETYVNQTVSLPDSLPVKDSVFLHTYYFVAGDNAPASTDSRQWGLLQEDYIIGKAVCILFSIDNEKRWRKERFFRKLR